MELKDEILGEGHYSVAASPDAVFDALGSGFTMGNLDKRMQQTPNAVLALQIRDDGAARWPWELARRDGRPLASHYDAAVVRTAPSAATRSPLDPVFSPAVYVSILNERNERTESGYVGQLLADLYGDYARCLVGEPYAFAAGEVAKRGSDVRIVHLVADCIERRRAPVLQLGEDHLTPERLVSALGLHRPTLLILGLGYRESDSVAAEQQMFANAFCWHLLRNASDLSVICGSFAGGSDLDTLRLLIHGLGEGTPLVDLVGTLQRYLTTHPRGRHPLHEAVSLSSNAFRRRFRLGAG
jgi:hypothetical protein